METLGGRIDAEFELSRDRLRRLRREAPDGVRCRQQRLSLYEDACERMGSLWIPRLEVLQHRLSDRLQVAVALHRDRRQAGLAFTSGLARIHLSFLAMTDADVSSLVLEYSLDLLPSLIAFPGRDRHSQPLERIDEQETGEWIGDRLVEFVRVYRSLYENEYCLGGHLVEDPLTHVRFPRSAAAATLERHGKTFYFMSSETRTEYEAAALPRP
jgi:hypothetical protein